MIVTRKAYQIKAQSNSFRSETEWTQKYPNSFATMTPFASNQNMSRVETPWSRCHVLMPPPSTRHRDRRPIRSLT